MVQLHYMMHLRYMRDDGGCWNCWIGLHYADTEVHFYPLETDMAHRFIADLKPGEILEDQTFMVRSKDLRTTTQGSLYIHAVLADRTGQLLSRVWSATEAMFRIMPEGGFINLRGRCENYKGNLQFIIEAIRPVELADVDLGDFLPHTDRDVDEMFARVKEILGGIKDPNIAALMQEYLKDESLMANFRIAPAAIQLHHAFIGGLLEHTLNLLELACLVVPRYPDLNPDLMLAGLLLHDLGKTAELGYKTNFHYSDQGTLVGHLAIGAIWIERMATRAEATTGKPFPDRIKWALQHIVLSHHAKAEFGSPKVPAFPEAIAIHYLDNLDAKVEMSVRAIKDDRNPDSEWTQFKPALESKMFKANILDQGQSTNA